MIKIVKYSNELADSWNSFVKDSRNGMFMFDRNYMEYHSDRFEDHSLLIYNDEELLAVLPANKQEDVFNSHGGLSYGGLVLHRRAGVVFLLEAFTILREYLKGEGFRSVNYKAIPYIYHKIPCEEDLYILFRNNAKLYRRELNSVIDLTEKRSYTKGTKSNLSKARKSGLRLELSQDYELFMSIVHEILTTKHNTRPTHKAGELHLLSSRFPDNIKLYLIYKGEGSSAECLGGTITYETEQVLHTQYIGITEEGKNCGALDFAIDHLLNNALPTQHYFSFGISTIDEGRTLNEGLARNKESFGARAVVHDFYQIDLYQ